MQMNPAYKAKLVAALRSGKFKQCIGHLHMKGPDGVERYCLAGVMAEIVRRDRPGEFMWKPAENLNGSTLFAFCTENALSSGFTDDLHWKVESIIGLDFNKACVDFMGESVCLFDLNDNWPCSFAEAADLIEAQL